MRMCDRTCHRRMYTRPGYGGLLMLLIVVAIGMIIYYFAAVRVDKATKAMHAMEKLGIVREITGQQRNRVFAYDRYLSILSEGTEI